ncbi:MAG: radical SAM protein [Anaerolineae bacterium]|nr:radical SAM protein [Anaerolineae bacterium]
MFISTVPFIYSLELTYACNNNCSGCSNLFLNNETSRSSSVWQQILTRVAPHAQFFKLTGGEPTLHPEFMEIVRAITAMGIPFTLFTNARWHNPQAMIDLLTGTPQRSGLLISLHGPDAVTHEMFTNTPGSFDETCENIQRATVANLRVHTSTVLTRYNWNRVREIVTLAQMLGAKRAVFNRYLGLPMPDLEPEEWQLRQAMWGIDELGCQAVNHQPAAISVKYGNCIPQCFMPSSSTGCWAGITYGTIDPQGNLRPCNHSPLVVGNVLEASLEELWRSEAMNRWRALLPAECEECGELSTCHGGCRALIEIRRLERDPLAKGPLPIRERPPREVTLFEGARPMVVGVVHPESFGYVVMRGQRFAPVTSQAKSILDALDGRLTLSEIRSRFGQKSLDFVGSLYLQGLVELS